MAERPIGTRRLVAVAISLGGIALLAAVVSVPRLPAGSAKSVEALPPVAPAVTQAPSASPPASASAPPLVRAIASLGEPSPGAASESASPKTTVAIPVPTIVFDSVIHDYRVRYPDGWTPTRSKDRREPDLLSADRYRWRGASRPTKLANLEAFVRGDQTDDCSAPWNVTEIDGRRALRRAGCGRVDAAVMVGATAYLFSLDGSGPYDPVLLFGRIAATIELPEPFVSTIHDFTLSIPPDWNVTRATEPSEPERFDGPRHLRFTVALHREATSADPVEWANDHFHRRSSIRRGEQYCPAKTSGPPVKDVEFRHRSIDGHPAAIRSSCGYVDAAVVAKDRIYELSLQSPHIGAGGDDAAFALLAPRIDVGTPSGTGPVWSRTFVSKSNGYVLHYPVDWGVSPASPPDGHDVFQTSHSRARLSIWARSKPRRQELDVYAAALLPHHATGDGCHWSSPGIIWIPSYPQQFKPIKIAGHHAVVRTECDFIEAVVEVGDHALVLVFGSGSRKPGAGRTMFDLFTRALEVTERS
jgi:hypothetical protein